ncbi:hypothetical protein Tco_1573184, partial [Tanacetum coccineum]
IALSPRDQRHQYLRFKGLEYTDADITDFEDRFGRIYGRGIHWGHSVFTNHAWRRLFEARGPLVFELIMEFFSTFRFSEAIADIDVAGTLQFQLDGAKRRMSWRQFILALGLHTVEVMETAGFGLYWAQSARQISDMGLGFREI